MNKLLSLTLIRDEAQVDMFDPNLVRGILQVNYSNNSRFRMLRLPTIEHRDYLFPVGVYKLNYEKSPKFQRYLWEFKNIPKRSEIKFHTGYKSHHSRGCPLLSEKDLNRFHNVVKELETIYINVKLS